MIDLRIKIHCTGKKNYVETSKKRFCDKGCNRSGHQLCGGCEGSCDEALAVWRMVSCAA